MSSLKVNEITNAAGTGAPDFEDGIKYAGSSISSLNAYQYFESATEPSSPNNGAIWWDTTNSLVKIYANNAWRTVVLESADSSIVSILVALSQNNLQGTTSIGSVSTAITVPSYGNRGIFAGGYGTPTSNLNNDIEYITISTTGNATDFGNLTNATREAAGCSSAIRGLIIGRRLSNGDADGSIDYITISTTGNATSFGSLSVARYYSAALSDGTYGLTVGGKFDGASTWSNNYGDVIDRVTIDTTGNATDFGNTTVDCYNCYGVQDATRGVYSLATVSITGQAVQRQDKSTEYITMATAGNATYFGEMYQRGFKRATGSDATRGVFAQGYNGAYGSNNIEYITIQTTGNASDFGDALDLASSPAGSSNGTRMVMAGGSGPPPNYTRYDRIGYVTIQTTGNASDFGNLTSAKGLSCGFSGAP